MKYERLEVRLDQEHARKVAELREAYGTSTSEAVRRAIDEAHQKATLAKRLEIVRRMAEANIEEMPDPEELRRQLGRHPDYLQDDISDTH
jgi:hypothetical protein